MVCKILGPALAVCFFVFSGIVVAQTTTDPDEILTKDPNDISDSLERAQAKGKIVACADPYGYPYANQNMNPPGFDVEIMEALAARGDMRLEMYWADTGTRGGMSRALRRSLMKGRCDLFMGVSDSGDEDQLMGKLIFTNPYLGIGYVIVTQGAAVGKKSFEELNEAGIKIGVPMSTPIDNMLFERGIPRELYLDNRRIMRGMANGEVDAAIVWATAMAVARREVPGFEVKMAEGYVPVEGQRWNLSYMMMKRDKSLINFLNEGIAELLENGTIKKKVESYGVPFYAPFN
ncbi:MAG: hypothetical protein CMK56_02025 [Proteobacteria bacterium]|nr:hypothetical protein [Pseudomonadota bacterium]